MTNLINENKECKENFKLLKEHFINTEISDEWLQIGVNKILDYFLVCNHIMESNNLHFALVRDNLVIYSKISSNNIVLNNIELKLINNTKLELLRSYFIEKTKGVQYKNKNFRFLDFFQTPLYHYLKELPCNDETSSFVSKFDLEVRMLVD